MRTSKIPALTLIPAVLAALLLSLLSVSMVAAAPGHCPDGFTAKDESGADDNDLVLAEGTRFCVKSGSPQSNDSGEGNTGILTADGETTLQEYLFAAGIVDGSGEQGRDVSYWVTFAPAATPTPTPPTETSTPTPSGTPSMTPTGTPGGTPGATPPANLTDTAMAVESSSNIVWALLALTVLSGIAAVSVATRRKS